MKEFSTLNRAVGHLKTANVCFTVFRYYKPQGISHGIEVARDFQFMELAKRSVIRRPGPVMPRPPWDFVLPQAPPGHVIPGELQLLQRNAEEEVCSR